MVGISNPALLAASSISVPSSTVISLPFILTVAINHTPLILYVIIKLFPEIIKCPSQRHNCAVAKGTECPAEYIHAQFLQQLNVSLLALTMLYAPHNLHKPVKPLPAWRTLSA